MGNKKRDYRPMMQAISGLVNFNYKNPNKIKPSNKGKITKVYNLVIERVGSPENIKVFSVRSNKKFLNAQNVFNPEARKNKYINKIYLPLLNHRNDDLIFIDDEPKIVNRLAKTTSYFIPFNQKILATGKEEDILKEVFKRVDKLKSKNFRATIRTATSTLTGVSAMTQQTREQGLPDIQDRGISNLNDLKGYLRYLVTQYGDLGKWLLGVNIVEFPKVEEEKEVKIKKEKKKVKIKKSKRRK